MMGEDYRSGETESNQLRGEHVESNKITKAELEKYNVE